jgi:hypothetical protein
MGRALLFDERYHEEEEEAMEFVHELSSLLRERAHETGRESELQAGWGAA